MFFFVLAIIILVIGIVLAIATSSHPEKKYSVLFAVSGLILAAAFLGISTMTSVDTGHTGIVTTLGRVEDYTLDAGFHMKAPWQQIVEMDNRVQKATVKLACFSSDIQEVSTVYTINYQINKSNAQELYRTVGVSYYDTVITPNVSESVKTVTARYTAENLIGSRDVLADEIEKMLADKLEKYNIELVSSAIEDMDFTDEFTAAVEAKQVAVQNKLRAQTEQEQKTMEAQQAAERAQIDANAAAEVAKIAAQADLEVTKIQADAAEYAGQKEAAKNKAIAEWLTDDLIKYYYIQQWNGKLPDTYLGSDNVSTIIGIGGTEKAAEVPASD